MPIRCARCYRLFEHDADIGKHDCQAEERLRQEARDAYDRSRAVLRREKQQQKDPHGEEWWRERLTGR